MTTTTKLTPRMTQIVRLMRDGWILRSSALSGFVLISPDGVLSERVTPRTFWSMMDRKVVTRDEHGYRSRYVLTPEHGS